MAYDSIFKMSIQDVNGNYYSADLQGDGIWNIATNPTLTYIEVLPDGWADTSIIWERDMSYLGIFRSGSSQGYKFSMDARAILQSIRRTQGVQGYARLTIYMMNFSATAITYPVYYTSQFDFTSYSDNLQAQLLSISTLDSDLVRALHAYGDTAFNVPVWVNTGTDAVPVWVPDPATNFVLHNGIKLRYQANYTSAANNTPQSAIYFNEDPVFPFSAGNTVIKQWNKGAFDGVHTILSLSQYSIVANNGTTTFIGNDILNPFLIQGNQQPGVANPVCNETSFAGINNSQPYTRNNYSLKNLLKTATGQADFWVTVKINFCIPLSNGLQTWVTPLSPDPRLDFISCNGTGTGRYLSLVIFEIDNTDTPTLNAAGTFFAPPVEILRIPFDDSTGGGSFATDIVDFASLTGCKYYLQNTTLNGVNYSDAFLTIDTTDFPASIQLNYNKVYVLGLIADTNEGSGSGFAVTVGIANCIFTITSKFDSGISGVPIPAPALNPSAFPAMNLNGLLSKMVPYLATTNSNLFGFPVAVDTPFTFKSNFLSDPTKKVADCCPAQIQITSQYCLHDLQGQSYITLSVNQVFDFCKKAIGCGASIEYDALGNPTILRFENLEYYFDNTNMILDLGYDVTDFVIEQQSAGLGCNLKLGYTKADTNSDFAVDSFNTEVFYNTPLSNIPGTMDFEEDTILTDQYAIEKIRAQIVSQPIGAGYDPANPSTDNQPVALYCHNALLPAYYKNICPVYDPSNNTYSSMAGYLPVMQRNGDPNFSPTGAAAQSNDPTAGAAPYIFGLFYPETAINVELQPCRTLQRPTGKLLHSVLDNMDTQSLTFRNTGVLQYNNNVEGLLGTFATNLDIGGAGPVYTDFKDVLIGSLPAQLYRGAKFKVKSKYPINLYSVLNTNPNGYIRWFWKNESGFGFTEYKMFLTKAIQSAATGAATDFEGWPTPDMVF